MSLNTRRLLDLSVTLDNNPYTDPPPLLPKIDYMDHQQGWPEMAAMFPGLRKEDLPGDESWAAERLQITTHSGTHMDAPWHYASTTDGGKPAFGIDELPLEWCLQPGVKLIFVICRMATWSLRRRSRPSLRVLGMSCSRWTSCL